MHTLEGLLEALRGARGFDVEVALERKCSLINDYFTSCGLDAAVAGVSGGVDSAVALGLLMAASRAPGSPLRRVVGLLLPVGGRGTTHQQRATERGRRVVEALGAEVLLADLSGAMGAIVSAFAHPPLPSTPWAEGQLASVLRTPALYYAAALLQTHGFASLVVGTTNRDEGAWLGFFGKASDGMVDLQPLSDLHKSEVVALAERLGVPREVIDAPPSGDVFDGQDDEAMIGAPYWFVELYLMWLGHPQRETLLAGLDAPSRATWEALAPRLEARHRRNAHKYTVGTPSIHLDVYPRAVPGGWR